MSKNLIVRDKRLSGNLLSKALCPVITVSPTTLLSSVFSSIKSKTGTTPADALFILCHGYAGVNNNALVCMDAGGMGLQLGAEAVLHSNVSRWERIAGTCNNIVVYACAAANTETGNEGSTADGRYLMGALAIHTNADVYAGDRIQWYNPQTMNFGAWEGNLWRFTPSGAPPTIVQHAPVELGEVLSH